MEKHQSLKWLIKFCVFLIVFYWLHETQWVRSVILEHFSVATAVAAQMVLPRIGLAVEQTGTTLQTENGIFEIAGSCTGTLVIFLYAAAVLSFPCPWKSRIRGLLLGLVTITIINFIRTLFIVVVTSSFPGSFWILHVVVGQAFVIVGTVGIYLWWIQKQGKNSFLPPGQKQAIKTTGLFLAGFIAGYLIYYFVFLQSDIGYFTRELIGKHSAAVLQLFFSTTYENQILTAGQNSVHLLPACISSPLVVLFTAVVSALPMKFWKKLLIVVAGYWPLFYFYHVLSITLTVMSITQGTSTHKSFVYNHFSQLVSVLIFFVFISYYDWAKKDLRTFFKYLLTLSGVSVLFLSVIILVGKFYSLWFVPMVTHLISDSPELFFAEVSKQTSHEFNLISTIHNMFQFQTYIWMVLVGLDPDFSKTARIKSMAAGFFVILANCFATIAIIEIFRLKPNVFLLQTWIVLFPFAAEYTFKWIKEGRRFINQEESVVT